MQKTTIVSIAFFAAALLAGCGEDKPQTLPPPPPAPVADQNKPAQPVELWRAQPSKPLSPPREKRPGQF